MKFELRVQIHDDAEGAEEIIGKAGMAIDLSSSAENFEKTCYRNAGESIGSLISQAFEDVSRGKKAAEEKEKVKKAAEEKEKAKKDKNTKKGK